MQQSTQKEQWNAFLNYVRGKCSILAYENWFEPIELLSSKDDKLSLRVPNIFVKEYILSNYQHELNTFFKSDNSNDPNIHFEIAVTPRRTTQIDADQLSKQKSKQKRHWHNGYTFECFVEGTNNQFVKSVSMGLAKGEVAFSPLLIYGGFGLGKTHLLNAIGHFDYIQGNRNKKVRYLSVDEFIGEYVQSLKDKRGAQFKRQMKDLDMLIIDDVQILENKPNFQDELCNIIEALVFKRKRVVLSSDKPLHALALDERLKARLEQGITSKVCSPDYEARVSILLNKAKAKNVTLTNEQATQIAEHIDTNVRQLEGVLNRLSAIYLLNDEPLSNQTIQTVLDTLYPKKKETQLFSIDDIARSSASVFHVTTSDIYGKSRKADVVCARKLMVYFLKNYNNMTITSIATLMKKTHSTVIHTLNKAEAELPTSNKLMKGLKDMCSIMGVEDKSV